MTATIDAPTELASFARFCRELLTADSGDPLVLEDFQQEMLTEHFEGTRELLILISKKNGQELATRRPWPV
jgi:hypothetical protein